MRMSSIAVTTLLAATAATAQAKTEVEAVFTLLEYGDTTVKSSSDDVDDDYKETSLASVDPAFDLNIYADNMSLRFNVDATDGNEAGGVQVGWAINDKMYAGVALAIENTKETTSSKPDGGTKSESKEETNNLTIGPFVHYRVKDSKQMIEAEALLAQSNSKEKSTSDAGATETESTTETKLMLLAIGGNYRKAVWDRVYFGAGLSYAMSLSGDQEEDNGTTSVDSDIDYSKLTLTLVDALVEF